MDIELSAEIGGYFELDLPDYGDPFPNHFIKYQSGRAALRAALEFSSFKRILLPAYICDSVIQAVVDAGKEVEMYFLDDYLYPKDLPDQLTDECVLLYANYFGLCKANITRLLKRMPCNQLIIDNTQALFELPNEALATIYSPRKFVGVPDGGMLVVSSREIKEPEHEDTGSFCRMNHLLLRLAYTAKEGYSSFIESSNSLSGTEPLKMSRLTKRILASINIAAVKTRRRENFMVLADHLHKYNLFEWELESDTVPLCYPLVLNRNVENKKRDFAEKGLYIPTYWSEANKRINPDSPEHLLTNCTLSVPCDQRYTPKQLACIAELIKSSLNSV